MSPLLKKIAFWTLVILAVLFFYKLQQSPAAAPDLMDSMWSSPAARQCTGRSSDRPAPCEGAPRCRRRSPGWWGCCSWWHVFSVSRSPWSACYRDMAGWMPWSVRSPSP